MQFTLHFRHDIMSMLKAVPNPRKTAMAGKTPVHSGVIFYPKDRIAVHAAVRSFSFHHKEVIHEKKTNSPIAGITPAGSACRKKKPVLDYALYGAAAGLCILLLDTQTVLAADMWTQAETIMKDVYSKILGISTIAAIVTASVALLLMNFSKSGRTVDESRAWLKRIVISWAILNGLGFIMAYITPFFSGGQWNG